VGDRDGRETVWRFINGRPVCIESRPDRAVRIDSIAEVTAAARTNAKAYADWGSADETDAAVARDAFGIDVSGFKRVVSAGEVRKNVAKHGGDPMPVTESDFENLPDLVKRRQKVVAATRPGKEPRLISLVPDGDTTVIVEEVRKGRRKLALVSIRKEPGTDLEKITRALRAIHNRQAGSVAPTSETGADRSSITIYDAKGTKVKP